MRAPMLEDFCCVEGCGKFVKPGHVACRKHVRERRRETRLHGWSTVAQRIISEGSKA